MSYLLEVAKDFYVAMLEAVLFVGLCLLIFFVAGFFFEDEWVRKGWPLALLGLLLILFAGAVVVGCTIRRQSAVLKSHEDLIRKLQQQLAEEQDWRSNILVDFDQVREGACAVVTIAHQERAAFYRRLSVPSPN